MREILFRGKRMNGGAWVEGSLICFADGCAFICVQSNNDDELDKYEIIPETIGQYTGLTDKNGKKIFEGDILKGEQYPYKDEDGDYNYFAEVLWFDNSPAFGTYTFKNPKSKVRGISTGNCDYLEDFSSEDWEVIGNIHDNPELLKGGESDA